MTESNDAVTNPPTGDNDTEDVEQLVPVPGTPVSDGPARHHANADATHSPAPQARMVSRF